MVLKLRALLNSGVVPNILSSHVLKSMELQMNATPKTFTLVDGCVSDTGGVMKSLSILLDKLNGALNLLKIETLSNEVNILLFTVEDRQFQLYFGAKMITLKPNTKTIKLAY